MHVLTQFRDEQGISRPELARKLKVSRMTIWRWETGEREISLKDLPNVAKVTGIPESKLRPDIAAMMGAA